MSSFQTLLDSLSLDDYLKGQQFETVAKWFLENDPKWQAQVAQVWLWNDYPQRWGKDRGIDLVCEFKNGEHWAVQAKYSNPGNFLKKAEIDSFLSESNRSQISGRILIATTNNLGAGAKQVIKAQEKSTVCVLLHHLESSTLEFPASFDNLYPVLPRNKPTPRPHQIEAINAVVQGLATADTGQLLMACGTGKTFTALWIKEALHAATTLFLVPSLSLLAQVLREWCFAKNADFNYLCVCSDVTVNSTEEDAALAHTLDLGVPVTTAVAEIEKFLLASGSKVIFCTYQSSPQIATAQQNPAIPAFDIVFADEAHRCAGKVSDDFACVLDAAKIRARKRLFMTATPRIFSTAVKVAAEERGVEMVCMEDERILGPVLHRLTFSAAIERELLTDYKVLIVGVDDLMIKEWIEQRELLTTDAGLETNAQTLAAHIGLIKAIRDYELKRVISFHGRVQRAQEFAQELTAVWNWLDTEHKPSGTIATDYVAGKMSTHERSQKLAHLRTLDDADRRLLANARCLAEGVDVPALDGVAFIDPRKSQVDIVQAVGRAIRKSEAKTQGIVVLPVFIAAGANEQHELEQSRFKPIWDVLNALRSHDEVLAEELDQLRTAQGRSKGGGGGFSKIVVDLPRKVGNEFAMALNARIVEMTTASWHSWYGLLLDYVEEFGHARVPDNKSKYRNFNLAMWVSRQRKEKSKLNFEKVNLLESLPKWSWDAFKDKWNDGFEYLKQYVEEHKDTRVPYKFKYPEFNLGKWVATQKTRRKNNQLDKEKIKKLESLPGWVWDSLLDEQWNIGFEYLTKYVEEYRHARSPIGFKYGDFNLGAWVSTQRRDKDNLSLSRIEKLESLPGWVWDLLDEKWNEVFEYLKKYIEEQGHAMVSHGFKYGDFKLGIWVSTQRQNYKKNILDAEKIKLLESLPGWVWNPLENKWNTGFGYLKKYVVKYGYARVPQGFKYENFNLGNWVSRQRKIKDNLSLAVCRLALNNYLIFKAKHIIVNIQKLFVNNQLLNNVRQTARKN